MIVLICCLRAQVCSLTSFDGKTVSAQALCYHLLTHLHACNETGCEKSGTHWRRNPPLQYLFVTFVGCFTVLLCKIGVSSENACDFAEVMNMGSGSFGGNTTVWLDEHPCCFASFVIWVGFQTLWAKESFHKKVYLTIILFLEGHLI